MKRHPGLVIFCYLSIYLVWGSTYLFIGIGVETLPPALLVAVRFFVAGAGMLLITLASGAVKNLPTLKEILAALALGFLLQFLGNGLVTLGERTVPSYMAALVIGSTPLLVALFNRVFHGQSLTWMKILGAAVGMVGVGVLLYNGESLGSTLTWDVVLIIGGSVAWALGTSWAYKLPSHKNVFFHTGLQMLFAGILGAGVSWAVDPPWAQAFAGASGMSLFSLAYLTVIGGASIAAFNYLLAVEPSFRVTSYALINPVIAVFLGLGFRGESATPFLFYGVPLVLLGVGLMIYGPLVVKGIQGKK